MPALSKDQFWKSNPNQMALPGMEAHAHPGAVHLAQGYTFHSTTRQAGDDQGVSITAHHPNWGEQPISELNWKTKGSPPTFGNSKIYRHPRGEITWVNTRHDEGKGLATSLYGMGRTMASVKPRHSKDRSSDGDEWAPKSAAKHGGPVPKSYRQQNNERYGV